MISARVLRECADIISSSICKIFNTSLKRGVLPNDWKCARVTPLFKQGEKTNVSNYRPISVVSTIVKVFERIVYNQVYRYTHFYLKII